MEIIAAVRDAVGPEVDIMAEGHNRFSAHTALQLAEAMTPYQPAWFETPVPPHLISSIVEVAKRSPVPIACGEDYYRSFGTVRRAPQARSGAHRPARAAVPRPVGMLRSLVEVEFHPEAGPSGGHKYPLSTFRGGFNTLSSHGSLISSEISCA